jgi:Phosphate-induced protein 1 conserved region
MPYADTKYCWGNYSSPNGAADADAAASVASHELTEAITDPLLDAWYSSTGAEIGDLCAWKFGSNAWDSNNANQMWNGHYYELQLEYSNHVNDCVLVGP